MIERTGASSDSPTIFSFLGFSKRSGLWVAAGATRTKLCFFQKISNQKKVKSITPFWVFPFPREGNCILPVCHFHFTCVSFPFYPEVKPIPDIEEDIRKRYRIKIREYGAFRRNAYARASFLIEKNKINI